jgi:hypothetical protein
MRAGNIPSLVDLLDQYEQEHSFMRKLVLPQDDNRRTQWHGGYRWFFNPNVICLEKVRWVRNRQGRKTAA